MTSVVAPCLSALLLPPLLLLLLASSADEQVCAVCILSGSCSCAQPMRHRRQAVNTRGSKTPKTLGVAPCDHPSLVVLARRCCNSHSYAVCGDACAERLRAANVGCALHVSLFRHSRIVLPGIALAYHAQVARQRVLNRCNSTVLGMCTIDYIAGAAT
jgi:hypothetical protein